MFNRLFKSHSRQEQATPTSQPLLVNSIPTDQPFSITLHFRPASGVDESGKPCPVLHLHGVIATINEAGGRS